MAPLLEDSLPPDELTPLDEPCPPEDAPLDPIKLYVSLEIPLPLDELALFDKPWSRLLLWPGLPLLDLLPRDDE